MKIRLTINGKAINATLIDNATAKDFLTLLPMTLTLEDYAATEKISYLPRKLSTAGAPAAAILPLVTSPTTLPGGIWQFSTEIPVMREGSSSWAGSIPASKG